ncbi:penicillin-binding protein 1A [Phenylobacterium montanum]|uniref:Penicillin-binding protein 1A n=1 Tax=Phenylobacterium montanum TaxID=2823693 RepID=A0A975IXI5_9CAUL|nr:penicillin-binding protein 1A [Caulobacter sp. S6]
MATVGVVVLSVIALAGFSLAIYAAWLFHDMPDAADLADYRPPTATRVYAWDGTLIGEYSKERRIFVSYDQIPTQVVNAFLAAEDHNFFKHGGVDPMGLLRAMTKDVVNASHGKRLEGGSTITQQVAKNVLLGNEATIGRKMKEAILANRIEESMSKQHILELYLNEIWLGYHSYGVVAAAYNYFGKPLSELDLAQCAYLAALPKGPDNYHPVRNKAKAIARRNFILGEMADLGFVTRAQAEAAMKEDLVVQSAPIRAKYHDADYFVEEVRERGVATFGKKLDEGGYYMRTTLDPKLQTAARVALMKGLENYDRRHGWRGAWGHAEVEDGWQKQALASTPPSERRAWRAARVESAEGAVRVEQADGGGRGVLESADVVWERASAKPLKKGDLVFVEPSATSPGLYNLRQVPLVNGALVAIDPWSGRTLAMVGGYSFSLSNFNRATQANRQPGSSFKPFVYATALENGYTPASQVLDGPISLPGAKAGEVWSPENFEKGYRGMLPLRRGLELSLNTMTVRLAMGVGMPKIVDMAKRAGVVNQMDPVLAMALGAGETTPFKMTAAYSAFVNGGRRINPHLIEVVEDAQGKPVLNADQRECPRCQAAFNGDESPRVPPAGDQIMDPVTAYQITTMLQGVVQRGTAYQASSLGRPIGGKTGTTNDFRSAWFVGFSPDIVVGVFVGFDDNRSLGNNETGAVDAVPIFIDFMQTALKDTPVHDFRPPPNVKFSYATGIREAYRPGTEPKPRPVDALEGVLPGAPLPPNGQPVGAAPAGAPPPQKPPQKKPPADLTGLY